MKLGSQKLCMQTEENRGLQRLASVELSTGSVHIMFQLCRMRRSISTLDIAGLLMDAFQCDT